MLVMAYDVSNIPCSDSPVALQQIAETVNTVVPKSRVMGIPSLFLCSKFQI